MTSLFPTWWELLIPNLNITTIIGASMILLGIVLIALLWSVPSIFGINPSKIGVALISVGLVLVFAMSAIEDYLKSLGGQIVFFLSIATLIIGIILFFPSDLLGKRGKGSKGILEL